MSTLALASLSEPKIEAAFLSLGALASGFAVLAAMSISLLGILYMTIAIAPHATQKFSGALREHNIKSFFAGLGSAVVMLAVLAVTHRAQGLKILLMTLFGAALIPAFAAGAEDIGRRLFWASGKEGSRASHLASGWLVFAFGSIFPVIGWFLIFPYVTLSGLGSIVVGGLSSTRPQAGLPTRDIEFPDEK